MVLVKPMESRVYAKLLESLTGIVKVATMEYGEFPIMLALLGAVCVALTIIYYVISSDK